MDGEGTQREGAGSAKTRVAVVGAGSWGTVFASLLSENGHAVRIWSREPEIVSGINEERRNPVYSTGAELAGDLRAYGALGDALKDAELAAVAIPSKFLLDLLPEVIVRMPRECAYLSLTKGLIGRPPYIISRYIADAFPDLGADRFAVLSGPNLAGEILSGNPTAAVVASANGSLAVKIQQSVASGRFRVYTSGDVSGVEIGGCVKNIIAIAAGITSGLGLGVNARSVLITRGLVELGRFASALGALPETLGGLSGLGDLIATCSSEDSRNFQAGVRLAKGESTEEIVRSMNMVAEGITTSRDVLAISKERGISMPITEQVNKIIAGEMTPRQAISELMARSPKPEAES